MDIPSVFSPLLIYRLAAPGIAHGSVTRTTRLICSNLHRLISLSARGRGGARSVHVINMQIRWAYYHLQNSLFFERDFFLVCCKKAEPLIAGIQIAYVSDTSDISSQWNAKSGYELNSLHTEFSTVTSRRTHKEHADRSPSSYKIFCRTSKNVALN